MEEGAGGLGARARHGTRARTAAHGCPCRHARIKPGQTSSTAPRPHAHHLADIVKYYGCELGAQTKFDAKSGLSIVNGAHDVTKLVELLEGFIKKYVQCYNCGNPETVVKVKRDTITLKCKARPTGTEGVGWVLRTGRRPAPPSATPFFSHPPDPCSLHLCRLAGTCRTSTCGTSSTPTS